MIRAKVAALVSVFAAGAVVAAGCSGPTGPADERPAPADPLILSTSTGALSSGPPARLDVRVDAAGKVTAELVMQVSDAAGKRSAVLTALPTAVLSPAGAPAASSPLELRTADANLRLVRLGGGKIEGTLDGAAFSGPLAVTCSAPRADAPVSPSGGPAVLAVDETFTSPACKPYAALARGEAGH